MQRSFFIPQALVKEDVVTEKAGADYIRGVIDTIPAGRPARCSRHHPAQAGRSLRMAHREEKSPSADSAAMKSGRPGVCPGGASFSRCTSLSIVASTV